MNTIKLNLSAGILENAKQEADRIGISLQDFIRMLMGNYFASKDVSLLARAREEIEDGKYTTIDTSGELKKYLKNLKSQ